MTRIYPETSSEFSGFSRIDDYFRKIKSLYQNNILITASKPQRDLKYLKTAPKSPPQGDLGALQSKRYE